MNEQILYTKFLYLNGWVVQKEGYSNAMDGLETILTKDNMVMRVRWNDFPYLITVTCTITNSVLVRRYVWDINQFYATAKAKFGACPKSTTNSSNPSSGSYLVLLGEESEPILGEGFIFL